MRAILLLVLTTFIVGCGKSGSNMIVAELDSEIPVYDQKVTGSYAADISINGIPQGTTTDLYQLDFKDDTATDFRGRHNFFGIQTGYKKISGQKSSALIYTFKSTECANDTFQGTINLGSGVGSFSGTVCEFTYTNGTLNNVTLE